MKHLQNKDIKRLNLILGNTLQGFLPLISILIKEFLKMIPYQKLSKVN